MKKKLLFLTILIIVTIFGIRFYQSQMLLATYNSPNGNYQLIIKSKTSLFKTSGMTMPGQGGMGSKIVEVVLLDKKGNIIGKSTNNSNCDIIFDSILVEWDLENNLVWYGKSKTIHLKNGKTEC